MQEAGKEAEEAAKRASPSAVRLQRVAGSCSGHRLVSGCTHRCWGCQGQRTPKSAGLGVVDAAQNHLPHRSVIYGPDHARILNNLGNFCKNHIYPGKVGDPARTSVSWFAVLWRGLMIFHPHLLWVSLCWLICFSQAKRERKKHFLLLVWGIWREGPCWSRVLGEGC